MSNKEDSNLGDIELNYFFNRIHNLFNKLGYFIFKLFHIFKKNIIYFFVLIFLGVGIGYFFDKRNESNLKHNILVIPNFNSVNLLYDKVDNIESEVEKSPLLKKHIRKITVEPIDNIYDFLIADRNNLRVFDVINKNSSLDLEKFTKQESTSKNFKYQLLTIYTKKLPKDSANYFLDNYLKELNNDDYYNSRRKVEYVNSLNKKNEIQKSVEQINNFFDNIGYQSSNTKANVSLNSFNQINDLLNTKEIFLEEINSLDIKLIEQSKVIFESYRVVNIPDTSFPMKVTIPFIFIILLYILLYIKKKYGDYKEEKFLKN